MTSAYPEKKMSDSTKTRSLTATEQNWSLGVSHGTGTTVLALQMARPPSQTPLLHQILVKLKKSHPLLSIKLHHDPATNEWSFLESADAASRVDIKFHDLQSTANLVQTLSTGQNSDNINLSPCHLILEHEMNENGSWSDPRSFPREGIDVFFASVYSLSEAKCAILIRLHASVCDRTTAVSLLRELMELTAEAEGRGGTGAGIENDGEGKMGIESMIPTGMAKKTIWAHGVDMLGYSVNSFRLTNLKFKSTKWPRRSEVVRFHMNAQQTAAVIAGCKSRGIKLCGALAAAGLIAAHSTRNESDQAMKKKYGVVTLTDCRSLFQSPLSAQHYGFYHSAVLNIHTLKGTETFWDLANKTYADFERYKRCNKHFSDMADINFLMRKAIENPSLTASSSLRTSLLSVFEDPVIDNSRQMQREIGVEDYIGCASTHGVGPSIGLFDTIRDGELDCACVYPSPLHSREQVSELVGRMKKILIGGI